MHDFLGIFKDLFRQMQEDKILQLGIGGRILELGCYNGYLEIELAERGGDYVVGVDLNRFDIGCLAKSENLLDERFLTSSATTPQILGARSRVDFLCSDAQFLPFREKVFDLVICSQLLEHVKEPERILVETRRILKTRGKLFVSVPNRFCPRETHNAPVFLHWLPYKFWLRHAWIHSRCDRRRSTWFVHRFYTRFLLRDQLIRAGFRINSLQEAQYVPSKIYFLVGNKGIRRILSMANEILERVPFFKHLGAAVLTVAS